MKKSFISSKPVIPKLVQVLVSCGEIDFITSNKTCQVWLSFYQHLTDFEFIFCI